MHNDNVIISPIGYVRVTPEGYYLEIKEEYRAALTEAQDFSYLQVFFWCHNHDNPQLRSQTLCPKPYKNAPDQVGIFATRSPVRPNPLALTPVQVLDGYRKRDYPDPLY